MTCTICGERFFLRTESAPHVAGLSHVGESGSGVAGTEPPIAPVSRSSAELFSPISGETKYAERLRRIAIAIEDFQATQRILWSGEGADAKACRLASIEAIYKVRSIAAAETLTAEAVEEGAALLRSYEVSVLAGNPVASTRAAVLADLLLAETARKELQIT